MGVYDNTGILQAEIAKKAIIKQSAIEENEGRLK
jgi:hypothetical protein